MLRVCPRSFLARNLAHSRPPWTRGPAAHSRLALDPQPGGALAARPGPAARLGSAPRRPARCQRLLAVSALELVERPSVRSWSNPGPVLPVVVVAGVALVVNVDTIIFELLNKGVDVSNRHYAVV